MKSTFSPHSGHKMSLTRIFFFLWVETIKLQLSWFWAYTVFQYFQIKPPLPSVWGCATRKWQCLSGYPRLSARFSFRWVCHEPQEGGEGFPPKPPTRGTGHCTSSRLCWHVHREQPLWLSLYRLWLLIQNKWSQEGRKNIITLVSIKSNQGGKKERKKKKKETMGKFIFGATINLSRIEIHNNLAGRSQDLWLRNIHTDQHIPSFLAPSLPEWLSLTVTMINCLSLLFYKYISFI